MKPIRVAMVYMYKFSGREKWRVLFQQLQQENKDRETDWWFTARLVYSA